MTILLVGGGSGGHITPVLSVADEIKRLQPDARLIYVIGKGDKLAKLPAQHASIDRVVSIRAGKFRRYTGGGLRQLLDVPTQLKNVRDLGYFIAGFFQSLRLLRRVKPDAIFIKGGFVSVPVGLAAAFRGIPYITHDSDAVPGLANRMIARWARVHAVGQPVKNYAYDPHKTQYVGVPVNAQFGKPSHQQQALWRQELKLPATSPVLCITGGGLGATRLNHAIVHAMPLLLAHSPDVHVLHIAGPGKGAELKELYAESLSEGVLKQIQVLDFVDDLYRYSGVADVIVARAGANSLADFALQAKACVVVPNPQLTGGHQTKNAHALAEQSAIVVLDEDTIANDGAALAKAVTDLFDSRQRREALAQALHSTAQPDAATKLARLVLGLSKSKETVS